MTQITNKLQRQLVNRKHLDTWTSFTTRSKPVKPSYSMKAEKQARDLTKLMKEEWK